MPFPMMEKERADPTVIDVRLRQSGQLQEEMNMWGAEVLLTREGRT